MAPVSMTLSDLDCHLAVFKPFYVLFISKYDNLLTNYVVCIHEWESICGLQSQLFPKMKDFSSLGPPTGSHVHRKSGTIKVMVKDRHLVTTHR